jgi:hypothetical protein
MGCLFVIFAGVFPRLAVLIVWIARPERVDAAFSTLPVAAVGHHLPAVCDPDLSAVAHPRSGAERLGLVLGRARRAAGHRTLGGQRHPAQPDPRQAPLTSVRPYGCIVRAAQSRPLTTSLAALLTSMERVDA